MLKRRYLSVLSVFILLFGALSFVPVQAQEGVGQALPSNAVSVPAQAQEAVVQALAPSTVIYNLYATDNTVYMADGLDVYNYGFIGGRQGQQIYYLDNTGALQGPVTVPDPTGGPVVGDEATLQGNAQFPAPLIYATTADVVEIRLKNLGVTNPNAPNDPHSIHLHGLDVSAANDGVPETSVGAVPANLCFDGTTSADCSGNGGSAPGAGNVIVYMFSPKRAGTYFYHCHQEASIHVQMGMYGALVIYNPNDAAAATGPGSGKGGKLYDWKYDKDYVILETEIDVRQHESEQTSGDFNPVDYHPQYWFINGLSFPNTIHVGFNWDDWIKAHPGYDPLITGSISKKERVMLRMINMGFETQPMHMHGFHGKVIGSDQRAWSWANAPGTPFGKGLEKNTLTIGSGEAYEWLIDFSQQSLNSPYPAGTQTRYDASGLPVSNTQTDLPAFGNPPEDPKTYVGGPVVGPIAGQNDNPILPLVSGQYFPMHNHDDYKATNNGLYPGGMFTMIITEP